MSEKNMGTDNILGEIKQICEGSKYASKWLYESDYYSTFFNLDYSSFRNDTGQPKRFFDFADLADNDKFPSYDQWKEIISKTYEGKEILKEGFEKNIQIPDIKKISDIPEKEKKNVSHVLKLLRKAQTGTVGEYKSFIRKLYDYIVFRGCD